MELLKFKSGGAVKDLDIAKRTVEFYASVFDNTDSDNDIIRSGAYTKTIQENGPGGKNRILHLRDHDSYRLLGKPSEMSQDQKGLRVVSTLPDTELANETLKLYEAGVLTEHSVGISVIKATYPDGEGWGKLREILEVRLYEVSTVPWGANEEAKVIGTKSEQKQRAVDYMDKLWAAIRKGQFRDDTFEQLEFEIKKIQAYIYSLETPEPVKTTQESDEPDLLKRLVLTFQTSVKQ